MTTCLHPTTRFILVDGKPTGAAFCASCGVQLAETLPYCTLCGDFALSVELLGCDLWYCERCGTGDYISEVSP